MTIYLDVVLVENLCMNYIIFFASAYVLKKKVKHIRLIISALIGGIYSILAYVQILQIYSNIICKFILSIVMVYIAYKPKNIKELTKDIIFFYLVSFVFGGTAFALLYFIKPQEILMKNGVYVGTYPLKIAVLGGIVGFTILVVALKFIKIKLTKKDIFCNICIYIEDKCLEMIAILDTGNMLKDPITNSPVIIVEKDKLKDIFPNISESSNSFPSPSWFRGSSIDISPFILLLLLKYISISFSIHLEAYVASFIFFSVLKVFTPFINPIVPVEIKSSSPTPVFSNFLAIYTTSLKFLSTNVCFTSSCPLSNFFKSSSSSSGVNGGGRLMLPPM